MSNKDYISNLSESTEMKMSKWLKVIGICGIAFAMTACRGQLSEKPPVHPNMNMDQQPRKEAQEVNNFFEDGRSMRQPVEGTVPRGMAEIDNAYHYGEDENGNWVDEMPVAMTKELIYRGQDQYNVYCTPCHGQNGNGQGIIMTGNYGYVPAPSYHIERLREASDGELYSAIYNGVRSMPSYATQIKTHDRWAIVAYIRALQASQNVSEEEISNFDVDLVALQTEFQELQARQDSIEAARQPEETPEPSMALAEEVISANACGTCHNEDGAPGGIGPTWLGLYGSEAEVVTASGERITVTKDEDYIRESIVEPDAKKTAGYENAVMASYSYLADHEIESIIMYIKSLSDN